MSRAGTFDPEMTTLGMFSDTLYAGGWADADFIPPPGGSTQTGSFSLGITAGFQADSVLTAKGDLTLPTTVGFSPSGTLTLLGSFTLPITTGITLSGALTALGDLTLPITTGLTMSSTLTALGSLTLGITVGITIDRNGASPVFFDSTLRIGYEPLTATIQVGGDS